MTDVAGSIPVARSNDDAGGAGHLQPRARVGAAFVPAFTLNFAQASHGIPCRWARLGSFLDLRRPDSRLDVAVGCIQASWRSRTLRARSSSNAIVSRRTVMFMVAGSLDGTKAVLSSSDSRLTVFWCQRRRTRDPLSPVEN